MSNGRYLMKLVNPLVNTNSNKYSIVGNTQPISLDLDNQTKITTRKINLDLELNRPNNTHINNKYIDTPIDLYNNINKDISGNKTISEALILRLKQFLPPGCNIEGRTIIPSREDNKLGWNCYREKAYIMPSGTVNIIQGYEPFALDILLKTYSEHQIKIDGKVPIITWIDCYGTTHKYTPDIYLPDEKKLIEVKSLWTYRHLYEIDTYTDKINQVPLTCINKGYKYEYWVFDNKMNLHIINDFTKPLPNIAELVNQSKPKRRVLYLDNLDNQS